MEETTNLHPLHWRDLLPQYCTAEKLGELSYLYAQDKASLRLIAVELERRGIDPYAYPPDG